ncbi:glutamine amidotransferase [Shimia sp. R11_0]|uniref:glutamine amidotransferase n=1 Tax=Shimia sp. R11_0 TaxID=2821096 RepID=UPI001ADCC64B|nr:glutamine amidotransferase [Shimia sp. R11_0]MBO9478657.1 glutamine amidotransferase [Shimia sp. R11_0]
MKRFLILQLRPEVEASDGEFRAFLKTGGLAASDVHRLPLNQVPLPRDLTLSDYAGVIVGGGPGCVSDCPQTRNPLEARMEAQLLSLMPQIIAEDIPFLGCCLGIGVLGHYLDRAVSKDRYGEEAGLAQCQVTPDGIADPLLKGMPHAFDAFVGHKEALQYLPEGCVHLVQSDHCPFQMIRYRSNIYATQFHPEADGEEFSTRINMYRNKGYFPPEEVERLMALCRAADAAAPPQIVKNFVARYRAA